MTSVGMRVEGALAVRARRMLPYRGLGRGPCRRGAEDPDLHMGTTMRGMSGAFETLPY